MTIDTLVVPKKQATAKLDAYRRELKRRRASVAGRAGPGRGCVIAPATKLCTSCSTEKPITAFPPYASFRCRECKRIADRDHKRRRCGHQPQRKLDHNAIKARLEAGALHREIAVEFGCAANTVKVLAARYGLQRGRGGQRVEEPERPEVDLPSDPVAALELAGRFYRQCWQHVVEQRNGDGVRSPYTGVTAEQVVDGMTVDFRERVRLLGDVVRLARGAT